MRRLPALHFLALHRWALLLLLLVPGLGSPAAAQERVIASDRPERVALTIYRAPGRGASEGIDPGARDQAGYALVTETRTVTIPAGPAVLRFEGVAGGIFAETAIVAGLPPGVSERNLDADLLSPRTLYDRSLGRRVIVRRTNPATGRVTEEQAVIRSGAAGAAVLQLAGGHEALRCSGLPEAISYPEPPPGLVARPTLSIRTEAPAATTATITLSYLAGGFDWQADYVLTLRPDGRADLFAWVTLASSDVTPFADAATAVVAGRPKRQDRAAPARADGALRLRCWPTDVRYGRSAPPPPPPPPPPAPPAPMMAAMDVVVTGAKRMAVQEELGDLKLYRLPAPTTVAPRAQKQVAMLARDAVAFDVVYVSEDVGEGGAPVLTLRGRNVATRGLGVPLPAGSVAVFDRGLLVGEGRLADRAVGEEFESPLDSAASVTVALDERATGGKRRAYHLVVTNDRAIPIRYEGRIPLGDGARIASGVRLARTAARATWTTTVPANGRAELDYVVTER